MDPYDPNSKTEPLVPRGEVTDVLDRELVARQSRELRGTGLPDARLPGEGQLGPAAELSNLHSGRPEDRAALHALPRGVPPREPDGPRAVAHEPREERATTAVGAARHFPSLDRDHPCDDLDGCGRRAQVPEADLDRRRRRLLRDHESIPTAGTLLPIKATSRGRTMNAAPRAIYFPPAR